MTQAANRKRWIGLLALACLVGIAPLFLFFGQLYFATHYFYFARLYDSVDCYLHHFDPNSACGPYLANSLALASGVTAAVVWMCCTKLGFSLRSIAVQLSALATMAWLASRSVVDTGYILDLLFIEALTINACLFAYCRLRAPSESTRQYSIIDITSLTVIIALAIVVLRPMALALCDEAVRADWFRPRPIYWLMLLGVSIGLLSSFLPFATARRWYIFPLVIGFAYVAAQLGVTAFKQFALLRRIDCYYMPESFADMERGYVHWFLLHGVIQFGAIHLWSWVLARAIKPQETQEELFSVLVEEQELSKRTNERGANRSGLIGWLPNIATKLLFASNNVLR